MQPVYDCDFKEPHREPDWKPRDLAQMRTSFKEREVLHRFPRRTPENYASDVVWTAISKLSDELNRMLALGSDFEFHALYFRDRRTGKSTLMRSARIHELMAALREANETNS
jgi:hypothetical protein